MSRSALATCSAASSVQPPLKTASRAKRACSRSSSRSWLQAIVARSVCWRGSASRPPLSRSRRCDSRSRICAGDRTLVRAAASSSGERQVVQPPAELRDRLVRLEPRAGAEELDRLGLCQRRDRVLDLAVDAQQLAARDEQLQVRAGSSNSPSSGAASTTCSKLSSSSSSSRSPMCSARPSFAPSVCAIDLGHERRVAQRERARPRRRPALNAGTSSEAASDGEPRLPRAARARQRDESRAVPEQIDAAPLAPAPCRRRRMPAAAGSCSRSSSAAGSASCPSWKSATGSSKSFSRCSPSSVSSPSTSARVAAERTTWPPWPGGGDPRGAVQLAAGVALAGQARLARVQAHPHLDRPARERLLTLGRRRQRLSGVGEGVEEGVSLRVDLDATASGEGASQEAAVLRQRLARTPPRRAPRSAASSPRCR